MNVKLMWAEYSDFEIAQLAGDYGIADEVEFNERLELSNREYLENCITQIEYENAFPQDSLDFNEEVAYN
jgi:hypothetical protein